MNNKNKNDENVLKKINKAYSESIGWKATLLKNKYRYGISPSSLDYIEENHGLSNLDTETYDFLREKAKEEVLYTLYDVVFDEKGMAVGVNESMVENFDHSYEKIGAYVDSLENGEGVPEGLDGVIMSMEMASAEMHLYHLRAFLANRMEREYFSFADTIIFAASRINRLKLILKDINISEILSDYNAETIKKILSESKRRWVSMKLDKDTLKALDREDDIENFPDSIPTEQELEKLYDVIEHIINIYNENPRKQDKYFYFICKDLISKNISYEVYWNNKVAVSYFYRKNGEQCEYVIKGMDVVREIYQKSLELKQLINKAEKLEKKLQSASK